MLTAPESAPEASITSFVLGAEGCSAAARASYDGGIGRVNFVLVDLAGDTLTNVVERKDVEYAASLPTEVDEAWNSSAELTPEAQYRVFFHVYDRTGVNLVAYDRRDFTYDKLRETGV